MMTLRANWILSGERIANWSMYLIIVLICFPLTMILPSIIRMPLQLVAIGLFIVSLLLMNKFAYVICLVALFGCSYLYFIASWEEVMEASTFLYNSLCCWVIVLYAVLCIKGNIKFEKKVFWLVVVLTLITAVTTIIGLTQYPLAVRELGRGVSYSGTDIKFLYRVRNIASWSQVYGMVFILGSFAYFYKETKNKVILLTMVVTEICILRSQLTFAIFLSIATLALVLINAKSKRIYYVIFVALALAIFAVINMESILSWMIVVSEQFGLEMLTPKLNDLYNFLVLRAVTGDASARLELYTKSISAFNKYPLGLFLNREVQATSYIGYHSELFDVIGSMGVLGIILIVTIAVSWIRFSSCITDGYKHRFLILMFIVFCLIFILNPVFYSPQVWIGAFVLPAMLVGKEGKLKDNTKNLIKVRWR